MPATSFVKGFQKSQLSLQTIPFQQWPYSLYAWLLVLEQCFSFIHLPTVKVVWSYSLYVWLPVPEPCSHLSTCPQRINLSWEPRVLKSFLNQLALQYVKGFLKSQFSLQAILFQYDHVHCMRDFLSENNVFFLFLLINLPWMKHISDTGILEMHFSKGISDSSKR